MVIGQIVIVGQTLGAALAGPGPGTFQVTALPSASSATLKFLGYAGDVAPGVTISAGAGVSPANGQLSVPLPVASGGTGGGTAAAALTNLGLSSPTNLPLTIYGSGAPYALTTTAGGALLAVGTNPPSLTINKAGTWLVLARARFDFAGTTFAANQTLTCRIRKTNNTPADQSQASFLIPIVTTITETMAIFDMPPLIFVTAGTTDILELWGSMTALPGAGAVNAVETSLVAIKLY